MKQASTPQSKPRQSFASSGQTLLLVALSLVSVPTLVWKQQTVKAVEVEPKQLATSNNWRGASFPVENFQAYSSPFGYRPSATGGSGWEFHSGLDLAAPQGSYIRNWWAGKVLKVSDKTACGTHIVIQSGQWEHVYCHMKGHVETQGGGRYLIDREGGIQIWEGQQVSAGTRIGRVGMTGRSTGPHLHWGLKYANNYVDPALVLRAMYAQQSGSTQGRHRGTAPTAVPIRGVIFDLDGVLTDTSEFHYRAWKQLADEEGIPFDRQANERLRGLSRRDSLLQLLGSRHVTEGELQEMMARKNGYYEKFIQDLSPADLLPGAIALLDELRSAGVKVAIGSSSKNALTVIQRLGIADRIEAIADGYSVSRHKPAPDVFLHAATMLGLTPAECLVVEDAASGVEAALRAGMWVVGLGSVERVGAAHVVRESLSGVRWADLSRVPQADPDCQEHPCCWLSCSLV